MDSRPPGNLKTPSIHEMKIPSPYNFVPVCEQVYCPEWSSQVSHDIPFSDGICGSFQFTITAHTPIFVRNSGAKHAPEEEEKREFSQDEKARRRRGFFRLSPDDPTSPFAIPGTTIKGAIRTVLEIASFGKFSPIEDKRFKHRKSSKSPAIDFKNSIRDLANRQQNKTDSRDLAETMFGRVSDGDSLKGRVSFTAAIATGEPEPLEEGYYTPGSPKASFAHNYLEQEISKPTTQKGSGQASHGKVNRVKTYDDHGAKLRGWKRYFTHPKNKDCWAPEIFPRTLAGFENLSTVQSMAPLPQGTQFTGTVHVHNLRPIELGALLWAIELGRSDYGLQVYHRLGSGKPYGLGAVTLEVTGFQSPFLYAVNGSTPKEAKDYMIQFATCMDRFTTSALNRHWHETEQLNALWGLAAPATSEWANDLRYPELSDFKQFEQNNLVLGRAPRPTLPDSGKEERKAKRQKMIGQKVEATYWGEKPSPGTKKGKKRPRCTVTIEGNTQDALFASQSAAKHLKTGEKFDAEIVTFVEGQPIKIKPIVTREA